MTQQTYHGSCHCGAVRFAAIVDLTAPTIRCNCSFCRKTRAWAAIVPHARFALLAGESELTQYQFGAKRERHWFCRHCGVRPFGLFNSPRRGPFYAVSVTCLDDLSDAARAALPISYVDGTNDNWDGQAADCSHL